jgi:hypothetical protein
MRDDPIVEEIHRIRQEYAASFNYDMDAICDDLVSKERRNGRKVVSFPPKRPKGWIERHPEAATENSSDAT